MALSSLDLPETDVDAHNEKSSEATDHQLRQQLAEAERNVEQLTGAMRSNRDIGAAIGIVMAYRRVTQQRAFDLLRQASQRLNVKLRDVALDVIDTGVIPDASGDHSVVAARPIPKPPVHSPRPDLPRGPSLRARVSAALRNADMRDAAAAVRSSASRARGMASQVRQEAAKRREANGDTTVDPTDRRSEADDRNAEAIDNIWTGRDGDEAAGDRVLLAEASQQIASANCPRRD
jgi:hypothetical protein